ncbi:DUF3631 domain-containing protein [Sphingomonas sp. Leaf230]|uniref:DUF3631 domain-containing protein n=1 Tax=Sphingomonas sp. Leaf230 TaxID=1735694 RepID=UPI000ABA2610|nr:DUF3631 domain-containing protein [Sphingomonas sp. Leaf230]
MATARYAQNPRDLASGSSLGQGEENELRLRRRLWGDAAALRAVRALGLSDATIRHFRLGLNEPQLSKDGHLVERALAFPVLRPDGERAGRWSFLNLKDLTIAPQHQIAWTPGGSRTCYSSPVIDRATLLLVPSPIDMFLLWQGLGEAIGPLVIACPSMFGVAPSEWRDPRFWRAWHEVVLGVSDSPEEEAIAHVVAQAMGGEVLRCSPSSTETWADIVNMGGSPAELRRLIEERSLWRPEQRTAPCSNGSLVGDFSAEPVSIEGAYVGGNLYYPITMERRQFEENSSGSAILVQRYVTRILRSDGALLDVERLPAPAGTPATGRVLALSDGTRIISAPRPGRFGTWSFASIQEFIKCRADGVEPSRRALPRLMADVDAYLRSSVLLPHQDDYALAAIFVVATFVFRAFDSFPILLINGPKASGKSEFGQAMAALSCNAVIAGRISSSGLVRLLAESCGTVVLDDLESISSPRHASDDVAQVLKVSYKAATARRVSPGRDGRVEVLDFFSPKIVTNIGGADEVLLTRMIPIRTLPMTSDGGLKDYGIKTPALRDELHVWAMCEIERVHLSYLPIAASSMTRRDEIAAPLRAVADVAGGDWREKLERVLSAEVSIAIEPIGTVLSKALRQLISEFGVTEVAMPHLALEMMLVARGSIELPAAETLGRLLLTSGARERHDVVERRRLYGEVTRIYRISANYLSAVGQPVISSSDPFTFCTGPCSACRYDAVCDTAVPWLRPARSARAPVLNAGAV